MGTGNRGVSILPAAVFPLAARWWGSKGDFSAQGDHRRLFSDPARQGGHAQGCGQSWGCAQDYTGLPAVTSNMYPAAGCLVPGQSGVWLGSASQGEESQESEEKGRDHTNQPHFVQVGCQNTACITLSPQAWVQPIVSHQTHCSTRS